jgi:hypothetical protein
VQRVGQILYARSASLTATISQIVREMVGWWTWIATNTGMDLFTILLEPANVLSRWSVGIHLKLSDIPQEALAGIAFFKRQRLDSTTEQVSDLSLNQSTSHN